MSRLGLGQERAGRQARARVRQAKGTLRSVEDRPPQIQDGGTAARRRRLQARVATVRTRLLEASSSSGVVGLVEHMDAVAAWRLAMRHAASAQFMAWAGEGV